MRSAHSRRDLLKSVLATASVLGQGELNKLGNIVAAADDEGPVTSEHVRFGPDIEPLVRLIEDTRRESCPEMMLAQLRNGVPYRQLLAALYLANIRTSEINHPLAVLHSADQLALDLPVTERLLPILWALDSFKAHYPNGRREQSLRPLAGRLPSVEQAEAEFHAGMHDYDPDRAERAIVILVRSQGRARIAELLWRYGARDWFFIGHLPIWAANCWRPLETVGWQHAEPILRVLVTNIVGDKQDLQLQPFLANSERVRSAVKNIPATWSQPGQSDSGFIQELLALWRESSDAPRSDSPRRGEFPGAVDSRMTPHAVKKRDAACDLVASRLIDGKLQAGSVWDAVHVASAEMIMSSQKGPEPGHSHTSFNALHFAYNSSADPSTRLLILLQAVGWLFHFRENMADKGWLKDPRSITDLAGASIPDDPSAAVADILAQLSFGPGGRVSSDPLPGYNGVNHNNSPWRHEAAAKVFALANKFSASGANSLVRQAQRLLPFKANWDPHRIKFPIAALENCGWVSPEWRPHMLAAASYFFVGADALDNEVAQHVRDALRGLR